MRRASAAFPRAVRFVIALCAACPSLWAQDAPARVGDWRPIFRGIDYVELRATAPRPMRGHAVRIDLTAPGVEFLATPSNGERPGETDSLKTSSFLARHKCQVAINAAPFAPVVEEEGKPQDVRGLMVSQGDVVSQAESFPALLITRDNKATIADPPFHLDGVLNAVGGFSIVLKGGAIVEAKAPLHPRTAAGVSKDGRCLYLLAIDGRQPGFSEGATTAEVGAWLKSLGAWDGINLDGGGTTAMVIEDSEGKPRVLNRPIHGGKPGTERVAASHLGVKAQRLPRGPAQP